MIPSLDFTSELFDPYQALHKNDEVNLPYPKAQTYNNISEYFSHTFLKKRFLNELSKKHEKPRDRNYQWYHDTLGLSAYQRNYLQDTKKKKKRKGKKPVSIVTIPGSPLKSEKVTVIKSDFKDYCRRKYSSPPPPVSTTIPHVIKSELPSTLLVMKTELYDSSDDSCPDDELILKMKTNVQKGYTLKNVYDLPVSIQIKKEPLFLSSKSRYIHMHLKCVNKPRQIMNDEKRSKVSKPGHLNSSYNHSLNASSNLKSSIALNNFVVASSKWKDSSSASVSSQKKVRKTCKNCHDGESRLQNSEA